MGRIFRDWCGKETVLALLFVRFLPSRSPSWRCSSLGKAIKFQRKVTRLHIILTDTE